MIKNGTRIFDTTRIIYFETRVITYIWNDW